MNYKEFVKQVPRTMRGPLSETLIDILLEGDEGLAVTPSLAKTILHYWQRDQLDSEAGLTNLLKATFEADPETTLKVIQNFDLEDLRVALQPA
ncbi:hypothetical protein JXL21_03255 [Candidatus Bathyarchaeota archaeon]|nr:hypothetical protein [Candidatus Bathyarchaeota archaeon]